jgi:hypothetical protein
MALKGAKVEDNRFPSDGFVAYMDFLKKVSIIKLVEDKDT